MNKYTSAFDKEVEVKGGKKRKLGSYEERAAYIKNELQSLGDKAPKSVQKEPRTNDLADFSKDIVTDLPRAVQEFQALRKGSKDKSAVDISLGEFMNLRYGIATDEKGSMDNFLRFIGVEKNNVTLSDFLDPSRAGSSGVAQFTTIPELNRNYEWLLGEVIAEALRAGMNSRALWQQMISSNETVPYDRITLPVIKNPRGYFGETREKQNVKMGKVEFEEIDVQAKTISAGLEITDQVARNSRINILEEYLFGLTGKNLDRQLTYQGILRLINGNTNGGADAAPVVGVDTIGTLDYDEDWLEMVIGAAQLGYRFNKVFGVRQMIKQAMALPEFKGFDGTAMKAMTNMPGVPLPSEYLFFPTGAMPATSAGNGQLLFLDSNYAMKHYSSKPLTLESQRIARNLCDEHIISMTTLFVKTFADASMLLDTSVANTTNPFPAIYDAEANDQVGF